MTDTSKNSAGKVDPVVVAGLNTASAVARKLKIDFFVIGACARDLVLAQQYGLPTGLATKDIDLGIMIQDWDAFEEIRDALIATGTFSAEGKTVHRLLSKHGCLLDIIPFGAIESPKGFLRWPPDYDVEMNISGFRDAWKDALHISLAADLSVLCVSLAGLVMLKTFAWNDRHHEFPKKDAADIALIMKYYAQAGNEERLFVSYPDLMKTEDFDFDRAGVRLLGRDMARMMSPGTRKTILSILQNNTDPDNNDRLIVNIAACLPGKDYEEASKLLQSLKSGILDNDFI